MRFALGKRQMLTQIFCSAIATQKTSHTLIRYMKFHFSNLDNTRKFYSSMKKAKIIIIISVVILLGLIMAIQFSNKKTNNEEKFKEVTGAYETLMNDNDDQEFQNQKAKIENYIQSSSQFTKFPQSRKPVETYYNFGQIYKVEDIQSNDMLSNPHLVASDNLYQCITNNTNDILKIIPVIEVDAELAKPLMYYVDDFCNLPTNCDLNKNDIYLKFAGIINKKDYGVWYYYLVDQNGNPKLNDSWVSLHCSYQNGLCGLTGIFFNSKECSPEGVINSESDYSFLPINELDLK